MVGDQNLFAVVVESLKLPQAVARRLVRNFGAPAILESQIERLTGSDVSDNGQAPTEAVQLALAGNGAELVAHVEEKMRAGNLAVNAGRSPQAIADRMIEKVLETQFQLDAESADILRNYLAMEVPMGEAPAALLKFAEATDLSFGLAGKEFFRRVDALAAAGVDLADMTYKASLGRNLEYYTGILFEAAIGDVVVAGGGRYDRLCSLLGAGTPVPAVGFSISLDRVEEVL